MMWAVYGWHPKDVDELNFFQFMRAGSFVLSVKKNRDEHGHRTGW